MWLFYLVHLCLNLLPQHAIQRKCKINDKNEDEGETHGAPQPGGEEAEDGLRELGEEEEDKDDNEEPRRPVRPLLPGAAGVFPLGRHQLS